jgi:hypothetical protein
VSATLRRQVLVLAIALALFAACGAPPATWALVSAYMLAALIVGPLRAQAWLGRLPRSAEIVLVLLLAAPGVVMLVRERAALAEGEGLGSLALLVKERLRLEAQPAIAPPLVSRDRPQTFFVRAPNHAQVRVRLGTGALELTAAELGEGLYRIDYDPRRDGPKAPHDGRFLAQIAVDGRVSQREMLAVTPLPHPRWLAAAPDQTLAASVSEETDELVIVSARGLERRVPVGDAPSDCAFVSAREIAVSHQADASLWIVDAESGTRVRSLHLGERQQRVSVSPEHSRLAVARAGAEPELVLVDTASWNVAQRVRLEAAPDWIAFGPDAGTLIVASRIDARLRRYRIDAGVWRKDAELALGRAAVTLGRARDGTRVFVATTDYRPSGSGNIGNHFVQDQILTIDVAQFRVLKVWLTAWRTPRQSKPGDVDGGLSPMAIVESTDGALLVSFAGSDELWRVRENAAEPEIIDLAATDLYTPHGIAELEHGMLVVASPAAATLGLLSFERPEPKLLRLADDDDQLLKHDRAALARRLGERAFYEATRSGISCQSCHMHADSDEAAHNLGMHKLLPTLSVRGLLGSAPYLRDGSFARIGDLEHVAQTLYRGYLRRVPGRAQTLEAFVSALPRRANPHPGPARDLTRERRGMRAFARASCGTCHAPPAFSGLGQQLLRNVFPERGARAPADDVLDTPSLLSLAASPPYLSDGSAHSLRAAVLDRNRSNQHGDTARLSRAERDDLIAFLESL